MSGEIAGSMLIVFGVHCRLENICQTTNTWLETEEFQVGGRTVKRQAGGKVPPQTMRSWRKLRKADPAALNKMRVWQQPAAVMDSVLWRWQMLLDGQAHRQIVRITDSLGSVWSDKSRESAWLLNQIQCCVGAGQTPLQQPTDSHLAKPAKDAARKEQERLRQLMRLAAAAKDRQPEYYSGPREILSVALAMQTAMEDLNRDRSIVLQACFQTGWLAWRPDSTGKLVNTTEQTWNSHWKVGCGRLRPAQLTDRWTWLDKTGYPTLAEADELNPAEGKGLAVAACLLEDQAGLPIEPQPDDVVLADCTGDWLSASEQADATNAIVAPVWRVMLDALPASTQAEIEKLSVRNLWQKRTDKADKRHRLAEKNEKKAAILGVKHAEAKDSQAERWQRETKEAGGPDKRLKGSRASQHDQEVQEVQQEAQAVQEKPSL